MSLSDEKGSDEFDLNTSTGNTSLVSSRSTGKTKKKDSESKNFNLVNELSEDIKRQRKELSQLSVDKDELFGESIAAEIKGFTEIEKAMVKNEIRQVIYKYQISRYNLIQNAATINNQGNEGSWLLVSMLQQED